MFGWPLTSKPVGLSETASECLIARCFIEFGPPAARAAYPTCTEHDKTTRNAQQFKITQQPLFRNFVSFISSPLTLKATSS